MRNSRPKRIDAGHLDLARDMTAGIPAVQRELHSMATKLGRVEQELSLLKVSREISPPSAVPAPIAVHPVSVLADWADARAIHERVGLTVARLKEFHNKGWVRRAKLGESRSSAALYCTIDVSEALQRIAAGCAPRKKRMGV
jgi:hypothetical protein